MLQMVASGRGAAALPGWLVAEYRRKLPVVPVRLGKRGIRMQFFLGVRSSDFTVDYIAAFIELARVQRRPSRPRS